MNGLHRLVKDTDTYLEKLKDDGEPGQHQKPKKKGRFLELFGPAPIEVNQEERDEIAATMIEADKIAKAKRLTKAA